MFDAVLKKAAKQLLEVADIIVGENVAVTSDTWTSVADITFSNLTAHFINSNWEHVHLPIGCFSHSGLLTADELFKKLLETFEKCGLRKEAIQAVIANGKSTMDACHGAIEWELIACIHQFIDLITSIVFDNGGVKSTIERARQTVIFITDSNRAGEELDRRQVALNPASAPQKVINEVVATWWSAYAMLERMLELKHAVQGLVEDGLLPEYLTHEDWNSMTEITDILRPFKNIQLLLEEPKYVSLSFVPFLISKIRKGLKQLYLDENYQAPIRGLIDKMIQKLEETFGSGEDGTAFQENMNRDPTSSSKGIPRKAFIAMALDPRTKTLPTLHAEDKLLVWSVVSDHLCREITSLRNEGNDGVDSKNKKLGGAISLNLGPEKGILEDLFDHNDDEFSAEEIPVHVIAQNELTLYKHFKSLPMLDSEGRLSNPLVWWKMNELALPFLAKLARKILNIPAAAVPSRSVFSTTEINNNLKRVRLCSDITGATVFLRDCWNTAELQPKETSEGERKKRVRIN